MPRLQKYDKLYIYTIHGIIEGARDYFGGLLLAQWEDSGTTLLFFEAPMEDRIRNFLCGIPGAEYLSETAMNYEDWEAGEAVKATRAAGFLICPTWDICEPAEGETRILLDPGVAFGSGFHTTTRNSLKALRLLYEQDRPANVLDLGCGTGILTMGALLLGAEKAVAVDYTSMATDRARECFAMNGLADRVEIICGNAEDNLHHRAGLAISNIYIQVIEKLFLRHEYAERKWLLISGIHGREQDVMALELIKNAGREIVATFEEKNWYTYLTRFNR